MIRANTIIKNDTIHLNILITCSMLSILYMRFSMAVRLFWFHVVSMTFVMLYLFLWPYCNICHSGQRDHCHDYHGNEHHHEYHFFGPYNDLVTPIKNIALTPIPKTKIIAEFGSLKKSVSPIFITSCFNYSECTQD